MKHLIITALTLLLSINSFAQNVLTEKDFTGTWEARVSESRAKSMDMLFDGSKIIINPDSSFSFAANKMGEFSGKWQLLEGKLELVSPDAPAPIILIELSTDRCIAVMGRNAKIPFFRKN
ncbi:MAG: hypothetical protein ACI9IP_003438 [Arcticibacterium sp.]|jgi:hypothetical protein